MKKILMIILALGISVNSAYSQNKTIRGLIIDDNLEEISLGASITINDTLNVGHTNLDGTFQIVIPDSVKKISFNAFGCEPTSIVLSDGCDDIELIMLESCTYDFISLKKADKLDMKRFRRFPELHKMAFEKGIFKTDKACYTQEFIPFYEKKSKLKKKAVILPKNE